MIKAINLLTFALFAIATSYDYIHGNHFAICWAFLAIMALAFFIVEHIKKPVEEKVIIKDKCKHEFVFDNQLKKVGCIICKETYWYIDNRIDLWGTEFKNLKKQEKII